MLVLSILFLIASNAVTIRRDMSILYNRTAILILIYSILLNIISLSIINKGIGLHGGLLYVTNFTQVFQIFILIICVLILQITSFYFNKPKAANKTYLTVKQFNMLMLVLKKYINLKNTEHMKIIEYPLILLFVITGAIFLISSYDIISIFLSIELQSYGLYLLSTINRNSELSTTGSLIYFLLGGLSSCLILLGISLLYINSGTTNLDNIYIISIIQDINNNIDNIYKSYYINFSLFIFSIGFLFKISAAPFHFWSPDVYDAIPTIITTFVAIIAKISILVFLLELIYYTGNNLNNYNWTYSLVISSILSLIIGTVAGLTQFRIKRLLAYSTISHIGFILLALSISSIESSQAFIFYLIQYSISNLNAFIILVIIGLTIPIYAYKINENIELIDGKYSPIQFIRQLRGYFYINPWLSLSLAITIFSFVGVPPLIGFFAKQMVLSTALDNGYILWSLIAILTSVIGGVYYLNLIKEIFFFDTIYKPLIKKGNMIKFNEYNVDKCYTYAMRSNQHIISNNISITISIITLGILLFMFINNEWLSMGTIVVQVLFNF